MNIPTETDGPSSKFLLGLAPDHCIASNQPDEFILTTEEVSRLDNAVLRRLAAEVDHPDIQGKGCSDLELREFFRGQTTFSDFNEE